jgi:O-antigen/teichoic acid export membrane protein
LAIFEFKTQSQAVILGATLCYIWPSVLWLAAIPLFSSWFRMIESFLLKGSHRPEFKWDKDLGIDIIHFGMIVLLSSSLHFLSLHLDRFILAKLWTPDFLGVFVVGLALATAPSHLISHLCSRMLMPILATKRHLSNHELRLEILGWRKYFTFTLAPLLVIFYLLCQHFILSFYPLQYHDAAWIIPIMVIGLWPMILCTSSDPILYLRAHPWAPVIGNIYRCLHIIALPWVTSYYPEPLFALFWIAIRDVPFWICIQIALFRKGFSFLGQDVLASIWFFLFIILSHFISPITINSTTITSNTITSLFTEVFP